MMRLDDLRRGLGYRDEGWFVLSLGHKRFAEPASATQSFPKRAEAPSDRAVQSYR